MKRKETPRPQRERVTLRKIAQAARVSVMAVSYALRNREEVSARERRRIQGIAEELGYRPDPLLSHLMEHLRAHRTPKSVANLAVLTTLNAGFVTRLLDGAVARAERLGYRLDRMDVQGYIHNPRSLTRTLEARGVSGVLLAPVASAASYRDLLDWSRFAAVAMTYSIVEPHVHRVVTHHFDNAVRVFTLLRERGFRRIGFAMTGDMELRANHSYSAAYFRAAGMEGGASLPILLLDGTGAAGIRRWFSQHRPEAVVVANASQVRSLLLPAVGSEAMAGGTAYACLDYDAGERIAGIDQLFETIGAHAINALVAQVHRSERGLPQDPTVTMVEGRWCEAEGLYPFGGCK